MSILRCGQSGEINFDDIQSKKSWSLGAKLQAFKNGVIANDLMVNVCIRREKRERRGRGGIEEGKRRYKTRRLVSEC